MFPTKLIFALHQYLHQLATFSTIFQTYLFSPIKPTLLTSLVHLILAKSEWRPGPRCTPKGQLPDDRCTPPRDSYRTKGFHQLCRPHSRRYWICFDLTSFITRDNECKVSQLPTWSCMLTVGSPGLPPPFDRCYHLFCWVTCHPPHQ